MEAIEIIRNVFSLLTNVGFLINLLLLTFSALYAVFALVLVLQIRRLNQTLHQKTFSTFFLILTFVHAIAAVILLLIITATI